jgi:flagellar biosynthesis protein FlhG
MPHAATLPPHDQAEGLRRLFARSRPRFVPIVANPHVGSSAALLERLTAACAELGLHALVVDATSRPRELAPLDLGAAVEPLLPSADYLAAGGLSLRHVDAAGSTAAFLDALADAAPRADTVLFHASASELARLFARREVRPLLLADDRPRRVTHAYAGLKLLALRAGLPAHALLLAAAPSSPRAERIATQLARCAEDFVGAALHAHLRIDARVCAAETIDPALRRFVRELLSDNAPGALPLPAARPQAQRAAGWHETPAWAA